VSAAGVIHINIGNDLDKAKLRDCGRHASSGKLAEGELTGELAGSRIEDWAIEGEERDGGQPDLGASGGQLAVAARSPPSLNEQQGTAEQISPGKLATQRSALWL
jgi:hypothetical protein